MKKVISKQYRQGDCCWSRLSSRPGLGSKSISKVVASLSLGARSPRQIARSREPHKRSRMRAAARRHLGNRREDVRERPFPSGRIHFAGSRTCKRTRTIPVVLSSV